MKKLLLSIAVILSFTGYVWREKFGGRNDNRASRPNTSGSTGLAKNGNINSASSSNTSQVSSPSADNSHIGMTVSRGQYKDGSYTGNIADAYYGNIQVHVSITGGKITDVQFLQYPNDRPNSVSINTRAMPSLKQEAIQAQSAQVDGVSGATDTNYAFIQSLQSALDQAQP